MEDVRHINMLDANEQAYCHRNGEVVAFDGPFFASNCWLCPLLGGLGNGDRVDCIFDDANARENPVTFTKPNAAMSEAPKRVDDVSTISSIDSLGALNARLKLVPEGEQSASTTPQPAEGEEEMSDEDMQQILGNIDNEGSPEAAPAEGQTPVAEVPAKKGFPPKKK